MTNPNTYNTACMTGVIDNVDFTLRDDSTSVTMLIPPDTPVGTRTIIIPQGFTLAEHRIIRAVPAHPRRRGEGHHPASPPRATTAETPRIPRTPVRAAETRRHQRQ